MFLCHLAFFVSFSKYLEFTFEGSFSTIQIHFEMLEKPPLCFDPLVFLTSMWPAWLIFNKQAISFDMELVHEEHVCRYVKNQLVYFFICYRLFWSANIARVENRKLILLGRAVYGSSGSEPNRITEPNYARTKKNWCCKSQTKLI